MSIVSCTRHVNFNDFIFLLLKQDFVNPKFEEFNMCLSIELYSDKT